ncbi:MAG: RNA-binding protein [Mariniphaga sp.]
MNLFIANLSPASTTKDLQKLFSHYGIVTTVKVIIDQVTGRSKRYGFVEMPNNYEAREAMAELNNTSFQEKLILVRESQPTGTWNSGNNRPRISRSSGN